MPSQDERMTAIEDRLTAIEASGWNKLLAAVMPWLTGRLASAIYGAAIGAGVGHVAIPTPAPVEKRVEVPVERIIPYSPGVVKPAEEKK